MEIQSGELPDVTRYLEHRRSETLEAREPEFRRLLAYVGKYKPIHPGLQMVEIGTGSGAIPILCKLNGLNCKGLEISQQLVEYGRQWGRQHGAEPDIELANIESFDLGENRYDVVFASSVFEHIEHWRPALDKVFRALKPGGALFFESTNKFSFVSGEYTGVPLYGWLPDGGRYALRKKVHGPDIMRLGIDFNQFTYIGLRRAFRQAGFAEIHDVFDLIVDKPRSGLKEAIIKAARALPPLRHTLLVFYPATSFVCLKGNG